MNLSSAIHLAKRAHAKQRRGDGSPFIDHPIAVLRMLWESNMDLPRSAYITAILHDTLEDTHLTYEDILESAGPEVAAVVRVLTKDGDYYSLPESVREEKYLRRIRAANKTYSYALLIKMVDRIHNIQTASGLPEERRRRMLKETRDLYLPFLISCIPYISNDIYETYLSFLHKLHSQLSTTAAS